MEPNAFTSLLAVDLDGTMVGDPATLATLNGELVMRRAHMGLIYATGRTLASTLHLIATENLLVPDVIVANVGASIHLGPPWQPDARWERHVSAGGLASRVRAVAGFFPTLVAQPAGHQSPYKNSYYLDADGAEPTLERLAEALQRHRLGVRIVYSSGRDLDLVPANAGKGHAIRHVARRLGVAPWDMLACGDSGNDRDMLESGCRAAVVANMQPELADLPAHVFRTRASYAAGVHEALRHFGWL